jgi:hypothetical protein
MIENRQPAIRITHPLGEAVNDNCAHESIHLYK